ncbi:MAG: hypothetical protein EOO02_09995 [Chitinophagaceae bacterium]|nr:MAG: hypothetical protein EOO02_09995 [Chitinophagaceae bacterium]
MYPVTEPAVRWSIQKKFITLFMACFFGLQFIEFIVGWGVFGEFVTQFLHWYSSAWEWLIKWTGKHILHLGYDITILPNGSGDTTYNYVQIFLYLVISFIFATVYILIDRKRNSYRRFAYWLRVVMRYYLGYMLLVYGFIKVIKLQFPSPGLLKLVQPFGDSSPMGLAWTFIGYSSAYNIFIGGAEVLAGVLLFFKRTTLIGALLSIIVMGNVAAMNFAYDIPVKIFSVCLVIIGVYLASYDWIRLRNVFILNQPAPAAELKMPAQKKWKKIVQLSLKLIAIAFALYTTMWSSWTGRHEYGDLAPKPPLYGIYNVTTFVRGADTIPPLLTDSTRWRQMIIPYPGYAVIKNMRDSVEWMNAKIDTATHKIVLTDQKDSTKQYSFAYLKDAEEKYTFRGVLKGDTTQIIASRFDEKKFRLLSRGFNWVNEYPFNR